MDISSILKAAGHGILKEIPLGGLVLDVVEAAIGDDFDREKATGKDVESAIEKLSPEHKAKILTKQLDSTARAIESRNELKKKMEEDTPASRARAKIAMLIAAVILIMSCGFGLMLAHAYIYNSVMPSIEMLVVVFGLPTIALLTFFGIDTKAFQGIILEIISRGLIKGKLK